MVLMNLTSSYSSFCFLHKIINTYLVKNNQPLIEYTDDDSKNIIQLKRFFTTIDSLRHIIFKPKTPSVILKEVSNILLKTQCLGKRNEDTAKKIINQKLGDDVCEIISGVGLTSDMKNGIDAKLNLSGKTYTAQIKPYTKIVETDDVFKIAGSSSLQTYHNVDFYIFINVKTKTVRIFKTKNSRIFYNQYFIPKENDYLTIVGNKNIKLIDCNKYL